MGLFDAILGRRTVKGPAPDRLFAITTAYVTLASGHDITSRGAAAIVEQLPPHASLASYRVAPHALAFYARRSVRRAEDVESAVPELFAGADAALLTRSKFLGQLGLDPLPPWMKLAWSAGDGQVLVLSGSAATGGSGKAATPHRHGRPRRKGMGHGPALH